MEEIQNIINELVKSKNSFDKLFAALFAEIKAFNTMLHEEIQDIKYFAKNRIEELKKSSSRIIVNDKAVATCHPIPEQLNLFIFVKHWTLNCVKGAKICIGQGSTIFQVRAVYVFNDLDVSLIEVEKAFIYVDSYSQEIAKAAIGDRLVYYSEVPFSTGGSGERCSIKTIN